MSLIKSMSARGGKLGAGAALLRAICQSLAWLPVTLALYPAVPNASLSEWLSLAAGASLLGAAIATWRRIWPWIVYLVLIAGIVGGAVVLGANWLPPLLYMGLAAGLGFRAIASAAVSMAGVATNGVALIAAVWMSALDPYKPLFILSGLIWFALSAYFTHAKLLDSAGLGGGIVTRLVSRSSRRYLLLLLAVVVIVYLATSDFHLWRTIADYINAHMPKPRPPEPEPQQANSQAYNEWLEQQKQQASSWPRWTDYILYGMAGAIGLAVLALLGKRYLLDLSWIRTLASGIRRLMARLFERREPATEAPYTEEKESLLDIGKTLREARNRWRSRSLRKPLSRREWEQLAARDKVRRLYQESLLAAVDGGYGLRAADTPSEALGAAADWYASREGAGAGKRGDTGEGARAPAARTPSARSRWLRQKRSLLADLYGRARYGSREATPAELEELAGEYPWDSRK